MLVLTRRPGESIIIGSDIKLTVVSVGPGRVKIGIEAPHNVQINREEIHARIIQEQEQAADVVDIVNSDVLESRSGQNTMTNSGAETGIIRNRIMDQLPAEPPISSTTRSTPTTPTAKQPRSGPPRKPR